jgi:hypothetical protein
MQAEPVAASDRRRGCTFQLYLLFLSVTGVPAAGELLVRLANLSIRMKSKTGDQRTSHKSAPEGEEIRHG